MLREIIVPKERDYLLKIPEKYLNRQVEILVLPMDNMPISIPDSKNPDILRKTSGILKNRNIDPLKWQQNIRSEWDNRK
jgi:hypothetical protein